MAEQELTQLDWLQTFTSDFASIELEPPRAASHSLSPSAPQSQPQSIPLLSRVAAQAEPALQGQGFVPQLGGWSTLCALALCASVAPPSIVSEPDAATLLGRKPAHSGPAALPALAATSIARWIRETCAQARHEQAAVKAAVAECLTAVHTLFTPVGHGHGHSTVSDAAEATNPTATAASTAAAPSASSATAAAPVTTSGGRPQRQQLWTLTPAARETLVELALSTAAVSLEHFDMMVAAVATQCDLSSLAPAEANDSAYISMDMGDSSLLLGGDQPPSKKRSRSVSGSSTTAPASSHRCASSAKAQPHRRHHSASAADTVSGSTATTKKGALLVPALTAAAAASAHSSKRSKAYSTHSSHSSSGVADTSAASQASVSDMESDSVMSEAAELDLDLLIDHMHDPVLSRLLNSIDGEAATNWPGSGDGPELFVMPSPTTLSTPKTKLTRTSTPSKLSARMRTWDDCLRNLSEALDRSASSDLPDPVSAAREAVDGEVAATWHAVGATAATMLDAAPMLL